MSTLTKTTAKRRTSTKSALKLYLVTLDWNGNNDEEGDYCDKVWAKNADQAIKKLATDMAWHDDSGCETAKERKQFIADTVASAGPYAASLVASTVLSNCQDLMAGPKNEMSAVAAADFATIAAILKKYGAE